MPDKYIEIDQLKETPVPILRAMKKEGERAIKYYYDTMHVFKYPEKRIKTYDTAYFEKVLPIIKSILEP